MTTLLILAGIVWFAYFMFGVSEKSAQEEKVDLNKEINTTIIEEDWIEEAYWNMDARKKGYGEWENIPQSERDAFKWEVRALLAKQRKILNGNRSNND